ncbi:hypothetical protein [Halobacillus sp. Marseille-Q1614]|uniref:hypothetical protein n=1 Tax=Halobacillus sp. Marseille-Q1614 TaxID=2709134 RepID=UPI0015706A4C|nr:hypothetical protein [Halobacillus sp. Marseille-Q1614]
MSTYKNALISITLIVLFGWALVPLYSAQIQFAEIIHDPNPPWEITIPVLPILFFLLIGGILTAMAYKKNKKKHGSWKQAALLPPELEESDERERFLTGKACRSSYVAMWYISPIAAALLLLYPFVIETMPYYPIIILLLIPLVQTLVYFMSWKKNY